MSMETYAAVVRVSALGRRKADSEKFHSDDDQIGAVEAWAKAKGGLVQVMEPELNVSGGLPIEKRPSLLAAIEGVEQGIYAGIVVAYLSRLGRNVTEQLRTWSRVEAAGGKIVTIREGIDTSTASGRLHRNLLISIDAHEREQHAERFEELRQFATEAGIWQRRQLPTGYSRADNRRLMPDPERGPEVVAAFRDFLAGVPVTEIARRLRMTTSGVRYLLKNRVYVGELQVGKYLNEHAHEALIDHRTFDEVQRKFADRSRPAHAVRNPAVLARLVRCASCGHIMTRSGIAKKCGGFNYVCVSRHSGDPCPAPAAISARLLEEHVVAIARAELVRLRIEANEGDAIGSAQARLTAAEAELDAYLDAVKAADVGRDAFAAGARKRQDGIEKAKDALYAELARRPKAPAASSGDEVWEELKVVERNALLRSLLAAVIVRPAGRKGGGIPMEERTRVVAFGTDIGLPRNRGHLPAGIVPIWPHADDVGVLGAAAGEDALEAASGVA